MHALVTASRLPFALEQIRKLGRSGHHVLAADSLRSAPGSRSRHAAERFVTASPRLDTASFIDDVETILRTRRVDRIVPSFEEVFYLARHRARLERHAELFAPDFDTLRRLHDKAAFCDLARALGLRVAPTMIAHDREALRDATRCFVRFFARPAYTRGGVTLYTNTGPLAGAVRFEECHPSEANPYLVQPFVEGRDICSYSIVHHGRVTAHGAYVHPLTLEHAGGIVFESVVVPESLEIAQRVAEATGYHGQLSFDLLETPRGLYVVECNPRPTAGLAVMPDEIFDTGMMDRGPRQPLIAPAGMRRQLSLALLRNMVIHPDTLRESFAALTSGTPDIYADPADPLPLLSQLVAYGKVIEYRLRQKSRSRSDLMQGYFDDLTWDGHEIASGLTDEVPRAA